MGYRRSRELHTPEQSVDQWKHHLRFDRIHVLDRVKRRYTDLIVYIASSVCFFSIESTAHQDSIVAKSLLFTAKSGQCLSTSCQYMEGIRPVCGAVSVACI